VNEFFPCAVDRTRGVEARYRKSGICLAKAIFFELSSRSARTLNAMKIRRVVATFLAGFSFALSLTIAMQARAQSTASPVTTEAQPGFTVVGFSVRTDYQKEADGKGEIPQLWQRVMQEGSLESVPHRSDNNLIAIYTDYSSDEKGEYTYVLGVRVSSVDKVPDGMIQVNVPTGKYAIVDSEKGPLPDVMPKVWQRIWTMPAAELGGQRAFKTDFEVYPEGFDWQDAQIAVHVGLK
jgi:predicted transcriptional regulator YdeE